MELANVDTKDYASTVGAGTRPGTPESGLREAIELQPQRRPSANSGNPFASPYASMPASAAGSTTGFQKGPRPRYFHSRRIEKGTLERPWLDKKDPREKWVTIIPIIGILVGLALCGLLIYDGLQTISKHVYCSVYEDDFSSGQLNSKVWTKEVEVGGFGYVHSLEPETRS